MHVSLCAGFKTVALAIAEKEKPMHLAQRQNDGRRCYPKICAGSVLAASLLMLVVCVVFWQGAVAHTDLPPCWSGARVERCEIASAVVKHVRMSQDECATFASAYKWYKCVGVWVTYAFVDPAGNRSLMIYSETRNDLRLFPQWFVMQNTSAWTTQQWQDARVLVLDKFVNVSSTWRVAATLVRDGRDGDDALQGWSALSLVSATGIVSRLYDSPLKTVEQASDRHVAFSPHRARPRNFNQNGREWWVNVWPRKSITAWWVPYIITSSVLAVLGASTLCLCHALEKRRRNANAAQNSGDAVAAAPANVVLVPLLRVADSAREERLGSVPAPAA